MRDFSARCRSFLLSERNMKKARMRLRNYHNDATRGEKIPQLCRVRD
jgi:hypothetical protein